MTAITNALIFLAAIWPVDGAAQWSRGARGTKSDPKHACRADSRGRTRPSFIGDAPTQDDTIAPNADAAAPQSPARGSAPGALAAIQELASLAFGGHGGGTLPGGLGTLLDLGMEFARLEMSLTVVDF